VSDPKDGDAERIAELAARIAKARGDEAPKSESADDAGIDAGGLRLALRVGTEMAAALVVSLLIGWALDRWLGTRPVLAIVFFFVGIGAGMLNVYRVINRLGLAAGYSKPPTTGENKTRMVETNKDGRDRD